MRSFRNFNRFLCGVTAALLVGAGTSSYAQDPAIPDIAARGPQCQLLHLALFASIQLDEADVPRQMADQVRNNSLSQMSEATLEEYNGVIKQGIPDRPESIMGLKAEKPLMICAARLFPSASKQLISQCQGTLLLAPGVAAFRRGGRNLSDGMVVGSLKHVQVGAIKTESFVDYFYSYPPSAYQEPFGVSRIIGGWIEKCLTSY